MPASCSSSVAEIAARALPARAHLTLVGDHILNWLAVGNYRAVVGQAVFTNNHPEAPPEQLKDIVEHILKIVSDGARADEFRKDFDMKMRLSPSVIQAAATRVLSSPGRPVQPFSPKPSRSRWPPSHSPIERCNLT